MARLRGNPHMNGIRIVMEKDNDKKVFYLFPNGMARDMTSGFGELVKYSEVSHKLKAEGYREELSIKKTRQINR
jgi:hypothetical protein